MVSPDLSYELAAASEGYRVIAGVDEVGRGPLAGPVVVAAVVLPEGFSHPWVRDSKKLSEKRREEVFQELSEHEGVVFSVVKGTRARIDRDNILQANHWAMRQAVKRVEAEVDFALIDGLPVPRFPVASQGLVKGDAKSLSIAAASILAKVTRDRMMMRYAKRYPQYGFERHKGYGTPQHLEALRVHGPCPIHRLSFAPVAKAAGEDRSS